MKLRGKQSVSPSKPKVVVGMPVYNAERWLEPALESWLKQTLTDFRLVISDNASTDSSFQISSKFAAIHPKVELHLNARNIGIAGNFRRAFDLGTDSDYFMWASSHDYFSPSMLDRCVATLERHPDAVICCGQTALFERDVGDAVQYIEQPGADSDSPFERYLSIVQGLRINNFVHGVIRTRALRDTPLVGDYFSSDNVLVAELALAGKIIQLPETTFYRRWNKDASTSKMSESERCKHWDPDDRGMNRYTHWKINKGFVSAVLRANIPFAEKRRTLTLALKGIYWDRYRLLADLREEIRRPIYCKGLNVS
jgi:glycosyltransferase involved in cell wall biosynthesis